VEEKLHTFFSQEKGPNMHVGEKFITFAILARCPQKPYWYLTQHKRLSSLGTRMARASSPHAKHQVPTQMGAWTPWLIVVLLVVCLMQTQTSLHEAADKGQELVVMALVDAGADVNAKTYWVQSKCAVVYKVNVQLWDVCSWGWWLVGCVLTGVV
jgi:hypothetical protein